MNISKQVSGRIQNKRSSSISTLVLCAWVLVVTWSEVSAAQDSPQEPLLQEVVVSHHTLSSPS